MGSSVRDVPVAFFGDEGDDILVSVDSDSLNPSGDTFMDGGIGNDTLIGEADDTLTGGAGEDVFRVVVNQEDDTPRSATSEIIEITDFNRGEDILEVFIRDTGGALVTPENIELTQADDGSYTDITVTANGAGDSDPVSDTFRIIGVSDLTLDDIVLVEDAQRPTRS